MNVLDSRLPSMPSVGHEASATSGSSVAHKTIAENVVVQSVVSSEVQSKVNMENTQKMAALMSKLGSKDWNDSLVS